MDRHEVARLVLQILDSTNDGDKLTDIEIDVLEYAINNQLSDAGWRKLWEIRERFCK